MGKIKHVLLVDDSDATNFFNKTILKKTECIEEVLVAKNGNEALEILKTARQPELIFLDINMPVMNGWEFIEEYQKIHFDNPPVIILMLGAELSTEEKKKADSIPEIKEFREKMLSKKIVCGILQKYFKDVTSNKCTENLKLVV
ncbi:response regulator [Aquimarina sp. D1M17]|uniref:response regulator n=1 Tax=Aquimarina acroporae TaxID=2937283 RepID=UPI0020BDC0B5|nr:response regulator [Aquimarina acroporae]MCK8523455.1 response regulator [Aquimarina acroporae]